MNEPRQIALIGIPVEAGADRRGGAIALGHPVGASLFGCTILGR